MMHWQSLTRDQRIAAVRERHEPGYTSTQLASFFEGATRGAIIGLYHRYPERFTDKPLPLAPRNMIAKPRTSHKRLNQMPSAPKESVPLPPPPKDAPTAGRPLVSIGRGMCWWPVNDADPGQEHLFCGEATDGTYCARHRRLAFVVRKV